MNLALYIMSAAISILLYLYMVSKNFISSSLLVVTEVEGGSILCAEYGRTCKLQKLCRKKDCASNLAQQRGSRWQGAPRW